MHGIQGGNILQRTSIWLLDCQCKTLLSPFVPNVLFLGMQIGVLLSSREKRCCCCCLIFPSWLFSCGHCGTKYGSQSCGTNRAAVELCCWGAWVFPGQTVLGAECTGNGAEWEGSWETAPSPGALALQVHSSHLEVWNNIFNVEEIRIYSHKMIEASGGPRSDRLLEGSWWFIP